MSKTSLPLTASQLREAANLAESIEAQQNKLTALLSGGTVKFTSTKSTVSSGGKRVLSPAVKKRIAEGQRARWAAIHASKTAPAATPAKASPAVPEGTPTKATSGLAV